MLDRNLRNRYSRQTMFPGIGEEGQEKLGNGRVVIIGCGALGTNIATFLVRAGVGKVSIIDRDFIEYHNLQRQVLFDEEDVKAGLPKAVAAEQHLRKVNSSVEIEGVVADINYTNIEKFCSGAGLILDGLDNFETRFLINDVALKHRIPWVYGGAIASSGMTMTIIPGETPCFRCISPFLPEPSSTPTCETAGIVGTVPAFVGSLQATEALKILVGAEINRGLITFDIWSGAFHRLNIAFREDCPTCHGEYDFLDERFVIKTTSFCGQSRAVQVVNTEMTRIDLDALAARLGNNVDNISCNEFRLRFSVEDKEIIVFPDGRAIIRNTIDESTARELYARYVGGLRHGKDKHALPIRS
jgi:molybdopterin/thiamine biosynthesis adenylyltransferase